MTTKTSPLIGTRRSRVLPIAPSTCRTRTSASIGPGARVSASVPCVPAGSDGAAPVMRRLNRRPDGEAARTWLKEQGATPEQIEAELERAVESLGGTEGVPSGSRGGSSAIQALRANLEEKAVSAELDSGQQQILAAVRTWESRLGKRTEASPQDTADSIHVERLHEPEDKEAEVGLTAAHVKELEGLRKLTGGCNNPVDADREARPGDRVE